MGPSLVSGHVYLQEVEPSCLCCSPLSSNVGGNPVSPMVPQLTELLVTIQQTVWGAAVGSEGIWCNFWSPFCWSRMRQTTGPVPNLWVAIHHWDIKMLDVCITREILMLFITVSHLLLLVCTKVGRYIKPSKGDNTASFPLLSPNLIEFFSVFDFAVYWKRKLFWPKMSA